MEPTTLPPTKIVLERRVAPGGEPTFEGWVQKLLADARATGSLEGSSVFAHDDERFVLLRFHTRADLDAWRTTAEARGLFAATDIAAHPQMVRTGLETWFTLPGHPLPKMPPPRWKMALLTWVALLPTSLGMNHLVRNLVPHELVVPVASGLTVVALTWLLMPNVTKLVRSWLYPHQ
jgi:antibiotic biosynthesis monooxygenase (ABM) superfamily enzyme